MFGMLKGNKNGFRGCEEGRRNILALGNLLCNRDPPRISFSSIYIWYNFICICPKAIMFGTTVLLCKLDSRIKRISVENRA